MTRRTLNLQTSYQIEVEAVGGDVELESTVPSDLSASVTADKAVILFEDLTANEPVTLEINQ